MAATKPSEETPAVDVAVVEDTTAPVTARRGRKAAIIITGAVVAVALIFGGGVAVGLAIPTGGPGFSQQGGPGGFPGQDGMNRDGNRPQMPGNGHDGGQNDEDSSDSSTDDGA